MSNQNRDTAAATAASSRAAATRRAGRAARMLEEVPLVLWDDDTCETLRGLLVALDGPALRLAGDAWRPE